MKLPSLFGTLLLLALPALAADPTPAEAVKAAAKKLAEAENYSWRSTTETPTESRWRPGPSEGKASKDGSVCVTMTRGENTTEAVMKNGKVAIKNREGKWQTPEEMESASDEQNQRRGGRFIGRMLQNFKTPAAQAEDLAGKVKELKNTDDSYAGDLSEEAVKELLSFGGRRREGSEAPTPTDARGSARFWVKDGLLSKLEVHVEGTMKFNENEMKIDRTTTTEVKEVGSTKLEIAEEAKQKLEGATTEKKS